MFPEQVAEARTEGRFEMSAFAENISRVLLATPTSARGRNAATRRWRWLRIYLFDPYRPELHYMRGSGPRWREKHERGVGC
jgi:hypothetical protein